MGFFLLLFVTAMVYVRVDLSISKVPSAPRAPALASGLNSAANPFTALLICCATGEQDAKSVQREQVEALVMELLGLLVRLVHIARRLRSGRT